MQFQIPKKDLAALKAIAELSALDFKALIDSIAQVKPTFSPVQFSRNVAKKVDKVQAGDVSEMLRVLFVLYRMKDGGDVEPNEIPQSVVEAFSGLSSPKDGISANQKKVLATRLKALLSFDKSIAVTAKAFDVMTEHERTFCRARILSDVRPVFTDDTKSASAAVIIHNLQIGYHDSGTGEHKEFYVALDTDDIQMLKEIIDRADKKTITLETMLESAKIPYLEV